MIQPPPLAYILLGFLVMFFLLVLVQGFKNQTARTRAQRDVILMIDSAAVRFKHLEDSLYNVYSNQ